jgi:hypothetical protein
MVKKRATAKKNVRAKAKRVVRARVVGAKTSPSRKAVKAAKPRARNAKQKNAAAAVPTLDLRYPYTGFRYRAEGPQRIRVDRGDLWGYFDAQGFWLEGPLKSADGPFCRYMSSNWIIAARAGKVRA